MDTNIHDPVFFGVRHLSPGACYHLLKLLDEVKPTAVLVEGMHDVTPMIQYMVKSGTKPPIAALAYTEEIPVRTITLPFAEYSPEYQAILWAYRKKVFCEFIDLPSEVFLKISYLNQEPKAEEGEEKRQEDIYSLWTEASGDSDYDTYWERNFEVNTNPGTYHKSALAFGKALRDLSEGRRSLHDAENLIRESFMRMRIKKAIDEGHKPEKIVAVTGAYHSSALSMQNAPMTEEEYKIIPKVKSHLTLMPYSYYRLTSRSGYGAGNRAPEYYGMMWKHLKDGSLEDLPGYFLSAMVEYLRKSGTHRSTAEVIEAIRLANSLAALNGKNMPTLTDIEDSAFTIFGQGDRAVISEALAFYEVGTRIGSLPEGVSRTSIQDDFYREIKGLRLEKYRTAVAQDLDLDLREDRRAKTEETAYLDLRRSFFLHRLKVLGISFQNMGQVNQQSATWAEKWVLRWTPEAEMQLVESTLKGDTIELATAFTFKEILEKCTKLREASSVIKEAGYCGMLSSMELARGVLQRLATDSGAFAEIAAACHDLFITISFGNLRKFEPDHLFPLLKQLFLRGSLILSDAAKCDNKSAGDVMHGIHLLNIIALEHYDKVDEDIFISALDEVSQRDDLSPMISGFCCAVLLERNLMKDDRLAVEVSRRLSPGIPADLGAGWFEGLSARNRYGLLARLPLWASLSEYIESLDDEQFKRSLMYLRRAFGEFGVQEKRMICENLGEIWSVGGDDASFALSEELTEEEKESLDELNDFNFDDI